MQPPAVTEATYGDDVVVPLLSYDYVMPGDSFRVKPVLVVVRDPLSVLQPVQLATDVAYADAERYLELARRVGAADVLTGVESVAEVSAGNADRREMQLLARFTGAVASIGVAFLTTAIAAWALARIRQPQIFLRRCVGDGFLRIHGGTIVAAATAAIFVSGLGALASSPEPMPSAAIALGAGATIAALVAAVLAASFRSTTIIALVEI